MKILKRIGFLISIAIAAALIYMFVTFPPIMAGIAAKTMCSCVFVMNREPQSVKDKELSVFPGLSRAAIEIDQPSQTVSASVLGRKGKAIFRPGLGCTMLAEASEELIRAQHINLPSAPPARDSIAWPTGDHVRDTILHKVNYRLVQEAVDSAFVDLDPAKPVYTMGVVVIYDGYLIGEKYAPGISKDSRLMGWSMTKSITNALVGLLVKDRKLKLDDPAPVKEWESDDRHKITLNNLMQASSGLKWSESYLLPGAFHNMFTYSDDKAAYAASMPARYKPNEVFEYSSGTTNILSRIVRNTVGNDDYYKFPYDRLFYKIGMTHTILEPDASGTFVGSSYGYATARDWGRFGLLYLQDGMWNGERILPEGWVRYSSTPAPAAKLQQYGAQWWLNAGEKGNPQNCYEPGLPPDAIMAEGFERQYVIVIPSRKLVIVRLGITHHNNFNVAKLVGKVMKAVP